MRARSSKQIHKERAVPDKKAQFLSEEADEACSNEQPLLDIEVRISNGNILVRVLCEKRKGVLTKLINTMESFNMSIVNVNYVPFGDATVDISILAEVEDEYILTVEQVKESLHGTLQANA